MMPPLMRLKFLHRCRSFRLLSSIALVMSWLAGPCHGASAALLLAVGSDRDHEVAICETAQSTTITLKHHRGTDGAVTSHCHHGLTALLAAGPVSPGDEHPDHVFQIIEGIAEEAGHGKAMVRAEVDSSGQEFSPLIQVVVEKIIWHGSGQVARFRNDSLARIPSGLSPPRSAVLLI